MKQGFFKFANGFFVPLSIRKGRQFFWARTRPMLFLWRVPLTGHQLTAMPSRAIFSANMPEWDSPRYPAGNAKARI